MFTHEAIGEDLDLDEVQYSPAPGLQALDKEPANPGLIPGTPKSMVSTGIDDKPHSVSRIWTAGTSIAQNIQFTHLSQTLVRNSQEATGRTKKECKSSNMVAGPSRPDNVMPDGMGPMDIKSGLFCKRAQLVWNHC